MEKAQVMEMEHNIKTSIEDVSSREESQNTVRDYNQLIVDSTDQLHPNHWLLVQARFHILTNEAFDKV